MVYSHLQASLGHTETHGRARRDNAGKGQNRAHFMCSIISSFSVPAVAQNADACVSWKLTFNRDFRSTEFQEIKINSCPASAASWGQCLWRGVLGTKEIFGRQSSIRLHRFVPTASPPSLDPVLLFSASACLHIKLLQSLIISGVITNNHVCCGNRWG